MEYGIVEKNGDVFFDGVTGFSVVKLTVVPIIFFTQIIYVYADTYTHAYVFTHTTFS